jgi:ATP-dependent helicase/nuclease subunit A
MANSAPLRELVLASAGSGKTYRISSRIVALLAHGAEPEHLLAASFTRKAAGQILSRVLDRLAEAVLDPEAAAKLAEDAALPGADPPPAQPAYWAGLLERVVRRLHRMNVGTLDSFFIRAAGSFAHELGMPPGWGIADEPTARRLRSEALQEVLGAVAIPEMVELLRLIARGEARRSVHDRLLEAVGELLAIESQLDPDARNPWGAFAADGEAVEPGAEARQELARSLLALELPKTRTGQPRKLWTDAIHRASEVVCAGDWAALAGITLCQRVMSGAPEFGSAEIAPDVEEALAGVLEVARGVLRVRLAAQVQALGRFTGRYAEVLRALQARQGRFGFEDVTRLIGGPDPLGARADLYYRLDARIHHLLLDEFQDTALPQWEALAPLVDEVLQDEGRAAVIVADPKQSIYAWRGAEPRVVHHVADRYGLGREMLARSWRSSQVVLDLVNHVFQDLPRLPILAEEVCIRVATAWAEDFAPHRAARALPGYVAVEAGPAQPGRSSVRPGLCRRVAERVAALHAEAPGRTIGVLTRKNATVARMILELRHRGLSVSEEGGNPLTDSAACEAVLALLRLADHPGDSIARYHVAHSPLGDVVGLTPVEEAHAFERAAAKVARQVRADLLEDGYGATLERWRAGLADSCDQRELRRLAQLAEAGYRYDRAASLRPSDFVHRVEVERVEDPTTAAVRVMTVHQSKGLEFDIVVLPELDEPLWKAPRLPALPYRATPAGRVSGVYPAVDRTLRCLFPELNEARDQALAGSVRDGLSTLYVALTRARHALHVVLCADPEDGPGTAKTAARLLREALAGGDEIEPAVEGSVLYEAGDRAWHRRGDGDAEPEIVRPPRTVSAPLAATRVRLRPGARRRYLPRRTPSGLEGGDRISAADLLRLDTTGALNRGVLVHAWFERIEWIENGVPSHEELRSDAARLCGEMAPEDLEALMARFRSALEAPDVRGTLSREAHPGDVVVHRELPFIHRDGERWLEGVVDRLVLVSEAGRVVRAGILDFKTDALGAGEAVLRQRVARYQPQMEAYAGAVASMFRLPREAVSATLLFLDGARLVSMAEQSVDRTFEDAGYS